MSRENRRLLDSVSDAASDAGSEALAAISNLGGGEGGGTVGRLVSAVAGRHGGFAPKVITAVTKHGIAGIERVEPLPEVDRGYRAVAADANGLESIRTIIELDPRAYDVTVTREAGAGVVEFVQEPEPEPTVASTNGGERDAGQHDSATREAGSHGRADAGAGARAGTVEPSPDGQSVEQARAEARKARAEAEAEKARAEAETARAEAEAAKARARAERARAEAEIESIEPASTDGSSSSTQTQTPGLDGGTRPASTPIRTEQPTGRSTGDASEATDEGGFGSFVAADPVDGGEESAVSDGIGRWTDGDRETGGFKF